MARMAVAEALAQLVHAAVRFEAYDGSAAGPADAQIRITIRGPKALAHLVSAPGELGFARAYVSGEMDLHAPDHYTALAVLSWQDIDLTWAERWQVLRSLGSEAVRWVEPPPQEVGAKRCLSGLYRHTRGRDAIAISHHYDVNNRFYELVLGPSMGYTCAVYPTDGATLEQAQTEKFDLVARKLALQRGQRLLDVGCGWGGMVRYAARRGVRALGVTLSAEQARWAQQAIVADGLDSLAQVRHLDYRDAPGRDYDAISSIGLIEHVGVHSYPSYFTQLLATLRPGGRLLNHCITVPDNRVKPHSDAFIDRYVFPDGELAGAGKIITEAQNVGFEVRHVENLREHYALTLQRWNANLVARWDECVTEVGEPTSRVWGLYMAASRLSFERNGIELHQILAVRPDRTGNAHVPLRPWWR